MEASQADSHTLFDLATIPVVVKATPMPIEEYVWCTGSGVPGDNCEFSHPVPATFGEVAWIPNKGQDARPQCRRCRQRHRNWVDSSDEDLTKAKTWWYSHTRKTSKWWDVPIPVARERFLIRGVSPETIAAEVIRPARERGICPTWNLGGCGHEFDGGRHDITGDVKDPPSVRARGYITLDDIHGQCVTCNQAKGDKSWDWWLNYCAFHHYCDQYRPPGWQEHIP